MKLPNLSLTSTKYDPTCLFYSKFTINFFFLLVLAFVFQKTIEFVTMSKLFGNFLNSWYSIKIETEKINLDSVKRFK
jgi:hypothetical protein